MNLTRPVSYVCAVVRTALLIALVSAPSVIAQISTPALPGVATAYSDWDPNTVDKIAARIPENTSAYPIDVKRTPTIPLDEYNYRKNSVPTQPSTNPVPPRTASSVNTVLPRNPLKDQPSLGFEGLLQSIYRPPSANAAAGPVDIIEVINSAIGRYTKAGTVVGTPISLTTWFQDLFTTYCPSQSTFFCDIVDPQVRYDQIHGRFLVSAQVRDRSASTSFFLLSVSKGATWDSGWKNWAVDATLDGAIKTINWADFPQIGFDDKAVYVTALMFGFQSGTYQYSKIRIFKKSDLYNPAATSLPYKDFAQLKNEDGTNASTIQPLHTRGRLGVGPAPSMLINASDVVHADYYTLWTIDDPTAATPTLNRATIKNSWVYDLPASALQTGTTVRLDTGQTSILKAVYRDGMIFTGQNVQLSDQPTTVLYTRFDAAAKAITLQSRIVNGNSFYPALDVPATLGPDNAVPPIIAGTTTAPNGTLTYPGISNVKAGEDIYDSSTLPVVRWGDYLGAAVDPVTGGMWVSGQYAKPRSAGAGAYGTWISYFPWTTTPRFDDVPATSGFFDYINTLAMWGITAGCTTTQFCPGMPISREQMAAFLIRGIYGDTFSYSVTPYFTDVPATSPFFKYVQKMKDLGITSGCGGALFCPSSTLTRMQASVLLVRAKMKPLFGDAFAYPTTAYFGDVPPTDPSFPFIQKMRELGYTSGCSTGETPNFCPSDPLTREQVAVFIVRGFLN